jgi:hypothetical protein
MIKKRSSKIMNYEDLPEQSSGVGSGIDLEELLKFIDELKAELRIEFPNMRMI